MIRSPMFHKLDLNAFKHFVRNCANHSVFCLLAAIESGVEQRTLVLRPAVIPKTQIATIEIVRSPLSLSANRSRIRCVRCASVLSESSVGPIYTVSLIPVNASRVQFSIMLQ